MDKTTEFLKKGIDALFLSHRLRTSLGVILGFVLHGLINLFKPSLQQIKSINIAAIDWLTCIVLGIFTMQAQTIYYLIMRKSPQNEEIDNLLQVIEIAKKEGFPDWQIRQMYYDLYGKMLQKIDLNDKTQQQLNNLNSEPAQSVTAGSGSAD